MHTPTDRDAVIAAAPWVALLGLGLVAVVVAIDHLLSAGYCSSTGYTSVGPAPECPGGAGWWVALLVAGFAMAICSGLSDRNPVQGWQFFLAFFAAIGVGALLSGADTTFRLVVGGGFLLFGAALGLLLWRVQVSER